MIFFTSDTHFGHANIIKYCNRPFKSVNEMDEVMIQNWNDRVSPGDDVYHLGDFGFKDRNKIHNILQRLNGRIHLIKGNHDYKPHTIKGFASVQDYYELKTQGEKIILSHYAMRVWNGSHRGRIMLYGHSHGTLPGNSQSLDVGVDCWEFKPVTLDEIKSRLQTLPRKAAEFTELKNNFDRR